MKLSCHCGSVKIEVANTPQTLTRCNCSICHRYGSLWGYYKPNEVNLHCKTSDLSKYTWGEKSLLFCRCNQCGCVTHYETTDAIAPPIFAVNFRMAPREKIEAISIRKFDGADTWKVIE